MRSGEDPRKTLMVRNIPNKYTAQMLIRTFDGIVPGGVDFIYLPMDSKNSCNVGYAFINVSAQPKVQVLYDVLHNKKWDRVNSLKVMACICLSGRVDERGVRGYWLRWPAGHSRALPLNPI